MDAKRLDEIADTIETALNALKAELDRPASEKKGVSELMKLISELNAAIAGAGFPPPPEIVERREEIEAIVKSGDTEGMTAIVVDLFAASGAYADAIVPALRAHAEAIRTGRPPKHANGETHGLQLEDADDARAKAIELRRRIDALEAAAEIIFDDIKAGSPAKPTGKGKEYAFGYLNAAERLAAELRRLIPNAKALAGHDAAESKIRKTVEAGRHPDDEAIEAHHAALIRLKTEAECLATALEQVADNIDEEA